jgi:hypothetical protein
MTHFAYMQAMHIYFLDIYAFKNFTHARYMKCMFGNLEVAK